ncbi:MAG: hypothetical protein A2007_00960 [Verrucomicrobia bacterium GWC2_42_7]|nr:MAG: hypothetical protein A2007_00960 [Verrucomicrobia bacterium GWC2_42_7]
MTKIHVLPDNVVNQIAAGEVIERPVAVVKELIENSIDAGSTRIEVEFRSGGKNYIRIEDNGCGMTEEEVLLCIERHATSKIKEVHDLQHVMSFGFRGEAIPSIASISKFTLQSRPPEAVSGTEIFINGGKFIHKRACGMPVGTRIEVSHLFSSVPVRRKFLKSDKTEAAQITQLIRIYAIAHPEVSFTLIEDGKKVFRSPICNTLNERVLNIFGEEIANSIIQINASEGTLSLSGLVSKPGISRSNKQEMITVVNGRPVDCRVFNFAIVESYFSFIPKGRYPIAFLFLQIDPAAIDVNVHPAKREIRFRNEPLLRSFIVKTIQQSLHLPSSLTPFFEKKDPIPSFDPLLPPPALPQPIHIQTLSVSSPRAISPFTKTEDTTQYKKFINNVLQEKAPSYASKSTFLEKNEKSFLNWKFICNLKNENGLFETQEGLLFLNWRAAHERIAYDQILSSLLEKNTPSQPLLFPIPVDFDPVTAAALEENLEFLLQHGIEVNPFGRNLFRIEALPIWISTGKEELFVRQLADFSREYGIFIKKPEAVYDQIAQIAIAKASNFLSPTTPSDATTLASKLMQCKNAIVSPTGKPTLFETSLSEINRKFNT